MLKEKKLTIKQNNFCKEYIKNSGNGAEAYRKSYNAKSMKDRTIIENASRLLKNSNITATIKKLQQPIQEKFEFTVEQSFKNLLKIQDNILNEDNKNYNAYIKAEELKGKLTGLYVDKTETKINGELQVQKVFITKEIKKNTDKHIEDFIKV